MMTTFNEWKKLHTVRAMVPALVKLDLDKVESWAAYRRAVSFADRSKIIERAAKWCETHTACETTAFMAVLWTMDYAGLAGEIGEKAGITNFLELVNSLDEAHRATVVGALAQEDERRKAAA